MLASLRGTGHGAAPVMLASVPATGADAAPAFPGGVLANVLGAGPPYPAGAPAAGSGVVLGPPDDFRAASEFAGGFPGPRCETAATDPVPAADDSRGGSGTGHNFAGCDPAAPGASAATA